MAKKDKRPPEEKNPHYHAHKDRFKTLEMLFKKKRLRRKFEKLLALQVVKDYRPHHIIALVSGGNDSKVAAHYFNSIFPITEVLHINTTIGIKKTRKHVIKFCKEMGWKYTVLKPPVSYKEIVLKHGFPGPGAHDVTFNRLKERCLYTIKKERSHVHSIQARGDRILFVSGVRLSESVRRMLNTQMLTFKSYREQMIAPIAYWSSTDRDQYMREHGIKTNPVTKIMCMSGECCCGCYATREELTAFATFFPKFYKKIRRLEKLVQKKFGTKKKKCFWGNSSIEDIKEAIKKRKDLDTKWGCTTCHAKFEALIESEE